MPSEKDGSDSLEPLAALAALALPEGRTQGAAANIWDGRCVARSGHPYAALAVPWLPQSLPGAGQPIEQGRHSPWLNKSQTFVEPTMADRMAHAGHASLDPGSQRS